MTDRRPWTAEEDRVLRDALLSGRPRALESVARTLGRTVGSCGSRVFRAKLSPFARRNKKTTEDARRKVLAVIRRGGSDAEAVRASGVHKNTVRQLLLEGGFAPLPISVAARKGAKTRESRRNTLSPTATEAAILAIIEGGPMPLREIHRRFGRGAKSSLYKYLRRLRRKGLAICEGKGGSRAAKWFSVGWWLGVNTGIVWSYAKKVAAKSPHLEVEDVVSVMRVEVSKCVRSFRPRGVKFSTYAISVAYRATKTWAVTERGRGMYYPQHIAMTAPYEVATGGIEECYKDGRNVPVMNHPEEPVVDPAFWDKAVEGLPDRLRNIVLARYKDGRTLNSVGAELGISRERVRQLEDKALARVRKSRSLDDYDI